jgi:hypothetical protein
MILSDHPHCDSHAIGEDVDGVKKCDLGIPHAGEPIPLIL